MAVPNILDIENKTTTLYLTNDEEFQLCESGLYPMAGLDTFINYNDLERVTFWS